MTGSRGSHINMKAKLEAEADAHLAAANDNTPPKARVRFRGGRPALNWLKRQDERAAAALWLVARRHLPEAANDNQADAKGLGVDRRRNGKPRGRDADSRSLDAYIKLPSEKPRLGDAEAHPAPLRGWWSDTIVVKSQGWIHPTRSSPSLPGSLGTHRRLLPAPSSWARSVAWARRRWGGTAVTFAVLMSQTSRPCRKLWPGRLKQYWLAPTWRA